MIYSFMLASNLDVVSHLLESYFVKVGIYTGMTKVVAMLVTCWIIYRLFRRVTRGRGGGVRQIRPPEAVPGSPWLPQCRAPDCPEAGHLRRLRCWPGPGAGDADAAGRGNHRHRVSVAPPSSPPPRLHRPKSPRTVISEGSLWTNVARWGWGWGGRFERSTKKFRRDFLRRFLATHDICHFYFFSFIMFLLPPPHPWRVSI